MDASGWRGGQLSLLVARAAAVTIERAGAGAGAGSSVWSGVYTEEQAKRGEAVSNKLCTSCHGPELSGGEAGPTLVGLEFLGNWTNLTRRRFLRSRACDDARRRARAR